jgi:glutamyl-Q tRNA(Asp) synthetase
MLGVPIPTYLHTPLVRAADGEKLSKQNGAQPLALHDPLATLRAAGACLGLHTTESTLTDWLSASVRIWADAFP